jgi:hypothetical protein
MRNSGAVAVLAMAVACGGGGKNVRAGGGAESTPEWVSRGTGAFQVESGKQLQAVGTAPPSDPRTRRQQADASAEGQMASGIDALAAAIAKLSDGSSSRDALSALAKKAATQAVAIRDHWVTPDGTEQSLEVLDVGAFKEALQKVDGDDKLKREVSANADRAFDSLMHQ